MLHWALSAAAGVTNVTSGITSPPQCVRSGIYVLDRERSDDIQQAITRAVAGLPNTDYFSRRLRKANTPGDEIRTSNLPSRFSIKYETRPQLLLLKGGEPTQWKLNDGQVFDVLAKANGEAVLLTFHAFDNERTTVYRIVGPQFVEETTITSPRLSTPIRYRLIYNQATC
ncbi:hypothetical protein [Sphingomonas sp. PAMC 26621]|uniref:hypothetical protein n=1 Tax=Sphingomonas sp. PAMC 26621 TaxID=1112213 RepID=UPI001111096B|nr:hypothetical protein [Sphingomonas sp. PAMC 26621]